jgi:6-phosphogluconolactonase
VNKNILVFVGTYSEDILFGDGNVLHGKGDGIYVFRLNTNTGGLTLLNKGFGKPNPSYLTLGPTKKYLYTVNEMKNFKGLESGAVSALSLDPEIGKLTLLNRRATGGTDPCHLIINDANTHLMVANFASGSLSVLPINFNGSLKPISCFIQHKGRSIHKIRQASPHVHNIQLDKSNNRAFVVDLGCDKVFIYNTDFRNGQLTKSDPAYVKIKAGEGPRHCLFHPSGIYFYVINELGSSIYSYQYDERKGKLELLQTISTLPDHYTGDSTSAAIKILPGGKYLYTSNRGHNSISGYKVNPNTGKLTLVSITSTGGSMPRDFDFDPSGNYLFAVNQDSHNIVIFKINRETGELSEISQVINIFSPVCIRSYLMD